MKSQGSVVRCGLMVAVAAGLMVVQDAAASSLAWTMGRKLEYKTVERSQYGPYMRPSMLVANSAPEWDSHMATLMAGTDVGPGACPQGTSLQVDWKKEAVLLVSLGSYASEEWEVEVVEVRRHGRNLMVRVAATYNPTGWSHMTAPYHLVKVPRGNWRGVVGEDGSRMSSPSTPDDSNARLGQQLGEDSSVPVPLETVRTLGSVKALYRK